MTPHAAYYVMIATERELLDRARRHRFAAPRRPLVTRIAAALESLITLGRPTTAQPV